MNSNSTAQDDFYKAKAKAKFQGLFSALHWKNNDLLSFYEVTSIIKPKSETYLGMRTIPVSKIIGSEGRYHDFSSAFMPKREQLKTRWVSVDTAIINDIILPPISVYSLGGYYFADYSSLIGFEAKRLRYEEGCDIVVASLHNGDLDTRYCHDIDAVFLGHDHVSDYFVDNYGIPHVKCWANGSDIRSVRFVRDENGNWVFDGKERDYGFAEGSELADETKAAALLSYYEGEFETVLNEEVGYAEETISTRELVSIATESLYRFYKRDSWYPEITMSIVNTGCARQDIVDGTITYGDVYASFPFDNDHIFAYVDGSDMSYVSRNNATYYEDSNWVKGEKYLVVVISYVYEKATYIYEEVGRDSVNRLRDVVSSYFLGEL